MFGINVFRFDISKLIDAIRLEKSNNKSKRIKLNFFQSKQISWGCETIHLVNDIFQNHAKINANSFALVPLCD